MTNHDPIGFTWSDSTCLCAQAAYASDSRYDPDVDEGNEGGQAYAVFSWDEDATELYCEKHNQTLWECAGYQLDTPDVDDEEDTEEDDHSDICNLSYDYLDSLPTLCIGQSDSLKIETTLARTSYADGEQFKHRVSIENYINGKWTTVYDYEAF